MGVQFRPTSRACFDVKYRADKLGLSVIRNGGGSVTRVVGGFILRAVGDSKNCVVTAIELPAFLAGALSARVVDRPYTATSVGFQAVSLASKLKYGTDALAYEEPNILIGQHSRGVSIGADAAWISDGAVRSSIAHVMPSAVLAAIAPDTGGIANTLVVYRTNAQVKFDIDPLEPTPAAHIPALGPRGYAGDGAIGFVEIGLAALYPYGEASFVRNPSACLEWGATSGIASAVVGTGDGGTRRALAIAKYVIAPPANDGEPYIGSVEWTARIERETVPDAPADMAAIGRLQREDNADGWDFEQWAKDYTVVYGQEAGPGFVSFPMDMGMARMWSARAGHKGGEGTAFMILDVSVTANEGITVSAQAANGGSTSMFSVVPRQYPRLITYAVSINAGALSFVKLAEFHYTRYNLALSPPGVEELREYYPLHGINTRDGEPRIACFVFRTHFTSGPTAPEPVHRKVAATQLTLANNTAYVMVSPDGTQTPISTPGYFIRACINSYQFLSDLLVPRMSTSAAARSCSSVSQGCANYAPGVMAAVVSPNADFNISGVARFHIAAIDVETGVMLAVGPALDIPSTLITGGWLSCVEQGSVDENGAISSHAVLLLTISQFDNSPTRQDGTYAIRNLGADVSWICREPSNTGLHYVGSAISPALIGVSTAK